MDDYEVPTYDRLSEKRPGDQVVASHHKPGVL
jgi:hypothetical protein